MKLTPTGFAHLTRLLMTLAGGKLVLALEGGYDESATAAACTACMQALIGYPPSQFIFPLKPSQAGLDSIRKVALTHCETWSCLRDYISTEELVKSVDISRDKDLFSPPPANAETNEYFVDEILAERNVKGKKEYLVSWLGYGPSENQWLKASDISQEAIITYLHKKKQKRNKSKKEKKKSCILVRIWPLKKTGVKNI